jgi:hypothetical protein
MFPSLVILILVASQVPAPTPSEVGKQEQHQFRASQQQTDSDKRGTEQAPMVVKISPPIQTSEETARDAKEREDKSANDRHVVYLTAALALIAFLQLLVYGYQSYKLNETVEAAKAQSEAMERHIAEAIRSADAIETIATNIQIGNRAVLRAYITVVIGSGGYQERNNPGQIDTKFIAIPTVPNTGFTQARNVRIQKKAAILPGPFPDDFAFPLPPEDPRELPATVGAHQICGLNVLVDDFVPADEVFVIKKGIEKCLCVWGKITYDDIFGIEHHTRFGHKVFWLSDGSIAGNYLPGQNDAD